MYNRTSYALEIDGQGAQLPGYSNYVSAVLAAYDRAKTGRCCIVIRVEGPDDDLTFTPECVVAPPVMT